MADLSLIVLDGSAVVVGHNEGLADLANQIGILGLPLQGPLVVDNGLFWLLDVHKGGGNEFEVFNAAFGV